MPPDFSF